MSRKADSSEFSINEIKKELRIETISEDDLRQLTVKVINENLKLIKEKEMRAMGPLMGEIMKQVRGKIDGAIVSKLLNNILKEKLKELK